MADDGFTLKTGDQLETMEGSGECTWRLVRKPLEVQNFGINMVEIGPGGQIPEHDETKTGQIEVFGILDGEAKFRLNGSDHEAPAGSFVRMEPGVTRTIVNDSGSPVTALLIGVPADSGYQPGGEWL